MYNYHHRRGFCFAELSHAFKTSSQKGLQSLPLLVKWFIHAEKQRRKSARCISHGREKNEEKNHLNNSYFSPVQKSLLIITLFSHSSLPKRKKKSQDPCQTPQKPLGLSQACKCNFLPRQHTPFLMNSKNNL